MQYLALLYLAYFVLMYLPTRAWERGRQASCTYWKMKLFSFKIWKYGFDGWILKYPKEEILPFHRDIIKNGKHWRLNIKLKGNSKFLVDGGPYKYQKWILFRPDIQSHALYIESETIKLSLGFVKYN